MTQEASLAYGRGLSNVHGVAKALELHQSGKLHLMLLKNPHDVTQFSRNPPGAIIGARPLPPAVWRLYPISHMQLSFFALT